ncbi:protein FAM167A-like [Colossoma macropomum]|uniref:protein FAM167A-like n=1 Tax=Colossoma macropomum TaxID=42526 RepID=UPI0018643A35|nr:protein FAM167A-like [Colossoma macropomum]
MNPETQYEDSVSIMVLENIKNKLLHAFRTTAEPRASSESSTDPSSVGRSLQANEELRRAKIDGAISWLRSELLEMRLQDRQLAQTLLGLNTEIQRLRRESSPILLDTNSSDQH